MDAAARLGVRAARAVLGPSSSPDLPGAAFLLRRWSREVAGLVRSEDEVEAMIRASASLEEWAEGVGSPRRVARSLVAWAVATESRGRFGRASELMALGADLLPDDPSLVLHRARLARKDGRAGEAREFYDRTRELADPDSPLARMADVGRALLDDDPEGALARVLRAAIRADDGETAGVALEARARIREEAGDRAGGVRDLLAAAIRFCDPVDRGRVLHAAADALLAEGSLLAARDVLVVARVSGHARQAERAAARLHGLATTMEDRVGRRRWSGHIRPDLVSLQPAPRRSIPEPSSTRAARHVARFRRSWTPAGL